MGAEETREAIACAEDALRGWSSRLAKDRAQVLRRWADLVLESREDLAVILTAEQGKPLAESKAEIAYAASFLEWSARMHASFHRAQDARTADDRATVKPQAATVCISTSQGVNVSNLLALAYPPIWSIADPPASTGRAARNGLIWRAARARLR